MLRVLITLAWLGEAVCYTDNAIHCAIYIACHMETPKMLQDMLYLSPPCPTFLTTHVYVYRHPPPANFLPRQATVAVIYHNILFQKPLAYMTFKSPHFYRIV